MEDKGYAASLYQRIKKGRTLIMKVHGSAVLLGLHVLLFTQNVGETKKVSNSRDIMIY